MPKPKLEEIIARTLEIPDLPLSERMSLIKTLSDLEELKLRHSHELAMKRAKKEDKKVYLVENSKTPEVKEEETPEIPIGVQVGNILEKLKQTGSGSEVVSGETNGSGQPNQSS